MSRIHLKSLLIRPPAKSIQSSRSFSIGPDGLWEMLCGTAGSSCLAQLKNEGSTQVALGGLYVLEFTDSLLQRESREALLGKGCRGMGWGSSGEEVMPRGGRNCGKQAGGVFPMIPATSFG